VRREVIVRAVKRVLDDLTSNGVDEMVEQAIEKMHKRPEKTEVPLISLGVFQKYSVATAGYGESERAIARILGFEPLFRAETWEDLSRTPDPGPWFQIANHLRFAKTNLPKILDLFVQETAASLRERTDKLPRELRGKAAITFILPEEEHEYSSPARLIAALEAVADLYSVFSTLEEQSESGLIVLACDSGSDKSFDFLGIAKLMEEIRKLVIAIWDRRVFYRHMHASQCIGMIAESLPVIERIEGLKQSGALQPEEAELLKRKALKGATQFLESGIYIDDMASEGRPSPRQLMRPEPKLLVAPTTTQSSNDLATGITDTAGSPSSEQSGPLTGEDVAHLERLLAKAKAGNSTSPMTASEKRAHRKGKPE